MHDACNKADSKACSCLNGIPFIDKVDSSDQIAMSTYLDIHSEANHGMFATVARIMKSALPDNAKIAKEAKECMQECVSEFISFITSEGK